MFTVNHERGLIDGYLRPSLAQRTSEYIIMIHPTSHPSTLSGAKKPQPGAEVTFGAGQHSLPTL